MARLGPGGKVVTLEAAAALVPDGAHLTISGFAHSLAPLALVRELIRQGRRGFELTSMGDAWAADMLAGAGRLTRARLSNYMFEGFGRCPNFSRAVETGAVQVDDYSHFAVTSRFLAGALGLPSLPIRSMLGTDLIAKKPLDRDAVAVAPCPVTGETLVYVKAVHPDFALVHAHRADRDGNLQLFGVTSTFDEMCRSAKRVIATVEEVVPERTVRAAPELTVVPGFMVDALVEVPYGAHPAGMYRYYEFDRDHVETYVKAGRSPEAFAGYLDAYVFGVPDHMAYLERIGIRRLLALRADPWLGYKP